MKEISQYINNQTKILEKKKSYSQLINNIALLRKRTEEFNRWLADLKQMMRNKLYRQTIK